MRTVLIFRDIAFRQTRPDLRMMGCKHFRMTIDVRLYLDPDVCSFHEGPTLCLKQDLL